MKICHDSTKTIKKIEALFKQTISSEDQILSITVICLEDLICLPCFKKNIHFIKILSDMLMKQDFKIAKDHGKEARV